MMVLSQKSRLDTPPVERCRRPFSSVFPGALRRTASLSRWGFASESARIALGFVLDQENPDLSFPPENPSGFTSFSSLFTSGDPRVRILSGSAPAGPSRSILRIP